MIIDVDLGNTRIKWRIAGNTEISFFFLSEEFPALWKQLPGNARFRISSVLSDEQTAMFCQRLASITTAAMELASVQNSMAGISIAYRQEKSFGVDRWLALLATHVRYPAADCIVVQAGTALVVDFLRADGRHLGGYLVSGMQTTLRALGEAAQALKTSTQNGVNTRTDPGATTLECIEAGISLFYRGFFSELEVVANKHFKSPIWVFTGGDAEMMLRLYDELDKARLGGAVNDDPQLVPGLVLDGLAIALP